MSDAVPSSSPREIYAAQPGKGCGGDRLAGAAEALCITGFGINEKKSWSLDALGNRQAADQKLIEPWIDHHGLWFEGLHLNELLLGGTEHDVARVGDPVSHVRRITKPTDEAY